jgi:hypothetical protein
MAMLRRKNNLFSTFVMGLVWFQFRELKLGKAQAESIVKTAFTVGNQLIWGGAYRKIQSPLQYCIAEINCYLKQKTSGENKFS